MYYVNKIKKNEIELLSKVRPLVPGGSRNPQWTIKVPNGDNLYRLNCCPECDKQIELSVYSFTPDYTRSLTVKYRVQCTNDGCIKRAGKKNQFSLATEQCDTLEEALDDWNNGDYYHRTIPPPRSGGRWTGD